MFFSKPIIALEKWECSNLETPTYIDSFSYSAKDPALADFAECLGSLLLKQDFQNRCTNILIEKKMKGLSFVNASYITEFSGTYTSSQTLINKQRKWM